ncbi:MAG: hydantoinase/oxoprolinase family protein [Desulfatiglandales bacterium]
MAYRVGVDIGGTFTDFCVFNESTKELHTLKVLSTPASPGSEVVEGIRLIKEKFGVKPADIAYFTHGQTVGVNTVIQRKGAKLCLFVTENFRDVLELERLRLPDTFNLCVTRAVPLVPRDRVLTIVERIREDGNVATPIDVESVSMAIEKAKSQGAEGIILSFLHSYANPEHEVKAKSIIAKESQELFAFCSNEVWPIIREYERTITAVINGYVHPRVSHYLSSLQEVLKEQGITAAPLITKSNGGVMSAERGKTSCVHVLLSGPAAGVIGASHLGNLCGEKNFMSLDIGGTSADVALVIDGMPQYGTEEHVGDFRLYIPTVSVSSIGEGGGSIAWVDPHGVLRVGPESAGSDPGPACYGKGGKRATLTDAFAMCGFLGQTRLAYDSVGIQLDKAKEVIGDLARQMDRDLVETAEAIIKIAISSMYMELSKLIAKYGMDPRDFALMPFGGAGPMIACFIAREIGIRKVLVPTSPGVLSAMGGLIADIKNDFIKTVYMDFEEGALEPLKRSFEELKEEAYGWLREEHQMSGDPILYYSGDMRYRGQSYEIEVPMDQSWIIDGRIEEVTKSFHDQHEIIHGYCDREAPIQFINSRLVIVGTSPKPEFKKIPAARGPLESVAEKDVFYDGATHSVPFFRREDLGAGRTFDGPAVILQDDCTTCVLDHFKGFVDPLGNIHLQYEG